jgi:tRNA pseudouridine55 synthase
MEIAAFAEEFAQGKVLLFNKPLYWTSFDVVGKVRNILKSRLNLKKLKVGHAGTLDPLATGLLILCTGKETRNIEKYQAEPKEYRATLTLGATTPSFDLETDVDKRFSIEHITREAIEKVLESLTGIQLQEPPQFSARFMNGTRAYKLARKGEPVTLASREITIQFINLLTFDLPVITIQVRCSKGTYIRALARDIGLRLDSGAYLSTLVRTHIGSYSLEKALTIEEFERNLVFS